MKKEIKAQLEENRIVMAAIEEQLIDRIALAVDMVTTSLKAGGKLLIMGNGGSAADSQHFAAEIVSRFKMERRGLPAIALTTDSSILTAIGNDYGFDYVFRRQIEALAKPGDVVVGISTSGSSKNVYCALETARDAGCRNIALLGGDGGTISGLSDISIIVPSKNTPRIQEGHIAIIHIMCDLIEKQMFAG